MKLIPLYKGYANRFVDKRYLSGHFVMVSDEDYEWLNQWKWNYWQSTNAPYAARTVNENGRKFGLKMHRLIMGCTYGDGKLIDHKDGNTMNCQRDNLRFSDKAGNAMNTSSRKGSSSIYLGVSRTPSITSPWKAQINVNNKRTYIGVFKTEIDAALAYNIMAKTHYGTFARLNEIPTQPAVASQVSVPTPLLP